jgi:hypothetical protein
MLVIGIDEIIAPHAATLLRREPCYRRFPQDAHAGLQIVTVAVYSVRNPLNLHSFQLLQRNDPQEQQMTGRTPWQV